MSYFFKAKSIIFRVRQIMEEAHVEAVMILGEAFRRDGPFDFGEQDVTRRIQRYAIKVNSIIDCILRSTSNVQVASCNAVTSTLSTTGRNLFPAQKDVWNIPAVRQTPRQDQL